MRSLYLSFDFSFLSAMPFVATGVVRYRFPDDVFCFLLAAMVLGSRC